MLDEDNLSSQLAENFDEAYDRDGCHPKRSFEISNNNHPQAMHGLVHIPKCKFSILVRDMPGIQVTLTSVDGYVRTS